MNFVQHICKFFWFGCYVQNLFFHFLAFYFVVSAHFTPFWGFGIVRANVASI